MHGYPVMQVVQYSMPPPCSWGPPLNDPHRPPVQQRSGVRKYVVWCLICGGLSCLIGIMFLGVYFLVRSYTSTVGYFETVPTFVPATLLMLTGLCIMSLARRRNRYSYLIKLSGACGLASALTCALVTVTTTVLHMSRLQALRECEYTKKTRTCTCYPIESGSLQEVGASGDAIGVRFVFDASDECTIVHSALYSCLRAVFGLSVAGVLVAVFSCMLVYQLLSHERKKMYWEQLELRCRSLYSSHQEQPLPPPNAASTICTPLNAPCRCCEQCHSHRNMLQQNYPWDNDSRYWVPTMRPAENFYSPNHPRDDHMLATRVMNQNNMRSQRPGWSWPRLPWQRNHNPRFCQTPSSPDSQYGFSNNGTRLNNPNIMQTPTGYAVINNGSQQYNVWGPPPPYSDPNSPVRRGLHYPYNIPSQFQQIIEHANMTHTMPSQQIHSNIGVMECHQHSIAIDNQTLDPIHSGPDQTMQSYKKPNGFKARESQNSTNEIDNIAQSGNQSNTLPFRKTRKRSDVDTKSIQANQPSSRVSAQYIFNSTQNMASSAHHENGTLENLPSCSTSGYYQKNCNENGVDNSAFQSVDDCINFKSNESAIYFADMSSCSITHSNDSFQDESSRPKKHRCKGRYAHGDAFMCNRPACTMKPSTLSLVNNNIKIPKDISRQSMCSVDSGEKTDFTDLSPVTPTTPCAMQDQNNSHVGRDVKLQQNYSQQLNDLPESSVSNFPPSFLHTLHQNSTKLRGSNNHIDKILSTEKIETNNGKLANSRSREIDNSAVENINSLNSSKKSVKNQKTSEEQQQLFLNANANKLRAQTDDDLDLMYLATNSDDYNELNRKDVYHRYADRNGWPDKSDRRL